MTYNIVGLLEEVHHETEVEAQRKISKVYVLQDENIGRFYQNRLQRKLKMAVMNENVKKGCENIRQCMHQAAYETLGRRKKVRSKKGLRIWNADILNAIEEKQ